VQAQQVAGDLEQEHSFLDLVGEVHGGSGLDGSVRALNLIALAIEHQRVVLNAELQ
jgi:hypothetical protein